MAEQYDNTNRGVLFKNDKGDNPNGNRPDYSGDINFNGVDMRIAAWLKVSSKSGEKFLSLSVSEKTAPGVSAETDASGMKKITVELDELDDQIPF